MLGWLLHSLYKLYKTRSSFSSFTKKQKFELALNIFIPVFLILLFIWGILIDDSREPDITIPALVAILIFYTPILLLRKHKVTTILLSILLIGIVAGLIYVSWHRSQEFSSSNEKHYKQILENCRTAIKQGKAEAYGEKLREFLYSHVATNRSSILEKLDAESKGFLQNGVLEK